MPRLYLLYTSFLQLKKKKKHHLQSLTLVLPFTQPYEFKVGATPGKERKREYVDNPNGLFSAQAAPKPPPAMYYITEGMKVGGKVRLKHPLFSVTLIIWNLFPFFFFFLSSPHGFSLIFRGLSLFLQRQAMGRKE